MRTKSFILVAASLAVLVVLGGALYAYDHARANEIAPGVKVAGVAVGGLSPDAARARLEQQILQPLERPIVVHHASKTWKLGPREARLRADLSAMVDEALARSRTGDVFSRSWRSLTGKRLDADLRPSVQYSDAAVIRLIDKVRRAVERPAKDASVKISGAGVKTIPGVEGLAVSASQLHRQIGAAITSTSAPRTFVAQTRHTQPKVTEAALKRKYDTVIVVNRGEFRLRLFKNLKLHQTFGIAVGQVGLETPAGPVHDRQQGRQPRLARAQQRVGGQAGRQGHRGRRPQQPDQGALAGHLRRRRHPRDRRRRLDRLQRLARLHPDARPGRREALRRGARGRAVYIA